MNAPPFSERGYDTDEADAIIEAATKPAGVVCDRCERLFANAHALAIHKGRSHRTTSTVKPNGKARTARKPPASAADDLRDLVAKFDRLAELRVEVAELERDCEALQQRLAKAWQR